VADAEPIDKGDKLRVNSLVIYRYPNEISKGVALRYFGLGKIIALGIFIVPITR
jgi:hypothetical protein